MTDSQKWMVLAAITGAGWLIYMLAPILTPFAVGALLAYLGDPIADKLEEWGFGRAAAVSIVFTVMTIVLVAVVLLLLPMLEHQVARLIKNLPHYLDWIKSTLLPWIQTRFGLDEQIIDIDKFVGVIKSHWQQAGGLAANLVGTISRSGVAVAAGLMNLFLIPVIGFYLLRDWDVMVSRIADLLPKRIMPVVTRLVTEADEVLGAFLRGQFSVMLALGTIYSIGLWMIDLELALLIGMVAGLISFIPYLGSIVGVVAACLAAIVQFHDVWSLIPVFAVFGVGQLLEGMVLTPLLVGDRIGLHPVAVIFAVLAGGQLFGFIGILLALPVASVVMVLLRHVHDLYKGSELYSVNSDEADPDPG